MSQLKGIRETVRTAQSKPPVNLFIDMVNLPEPEQVDSVYQATCSLGRSLGRLSTVKVYKSSLYAGKQEGPEVAVGEEGDYSPQLLLDVHEHGLATSDHIYVIVSKDEQPYNEVAKRLSQKGHTVILAGLNTTPKNGNGALGSIIYTDLQRLLQEGGEDLDLDNYDFTDFIRLMADSEERMAFVGARFFIRQVMWRLNLGGTQTCQEIFQVARDLNIIELYKSENIDKDAPAVSSCKLNRDHALVVAALEDYSPNPDSSEVVGSLTAA